MCDKKSPSVAYLRIESLTSSKHNPPSAEDQAQFLGENAARIIEQEWNKHGKTVRVEVVREHDVERTEERTYLTRVVHNGNEWVGRYTLGELIDLNEKHDFYEVLDRDGE